MRKQPSVWAEAALNGEEGIAKARTSHYDLILLDIMMPGMSGIEVLHILRQGKALAHTKIVILTNLGQSQASQAALETEADGYLIKAEVVPSKLLEIIKRMI